MNMKRIGLLASAVLLILWMSVSAFAHSGPQVGGEPVWNEVEFFTNDTSTQTHDESVNNPDEWYKGWWFVNLTNTTGTPWQSVTIRPGANDLVAIVEGDPLVDEWGFPGASVLANKAGTMAYSESRGTLGYRDYENGTRGYLWGQAVFTFAAPLDTGGKIGLRIYTDNSYYGTGPYASSFCMCITPTAVPEPSSLLALFGGVAALAGFARRRR